VQESRNGQRVEDMQHSREVQKKGAGQGIDPSRGDAARKGITGEVKTWGGGGGWGGGFGPRAKDEKRQVIKGENKNGTPIDVRSGP